MSRRTPKLNTARRRRAGSRIESASISSKAIAWSSSASGCGQRSQGKISAWLLPFVLTGGLVLVAFDGSALARREPESVTIVGAGRLTDCLILVAEHAPRGDREGGVPHIPTGLLADYLRLLTVVARRGGRAVHEETLILAVRLTRVAQVTSRSDCVPRPVALCYVLAHGLRGIAVHTCRR